MGSRLRWILGGLGAIGLGAGLYAERKRVQQILGQTTEGFDVSHYEPIVDWAALKASGRQFAYIKASEGAVGTEDLMFEKHWRDAGNAGIVRGPYHYVHPKNDPLLEAQHFFAVVQRVGGLAKADWHPAIDVETMDGLQPQQVILFVTGIVKAVEQLFRRPCVVYTGQDFWINRLGDPMIPGIGTRPLWIARYSHLLPSVPKAWSDFKIWQHSAPADTGRQMVGRDTGPVPGIPTGLLDLNTLYGQVSDLQAL